MAARKTHGLVGQVCQVGQKCSWRAYPGAYLDRQISTVASEHHADPRFRDPLCSRQPAPLRQGPASAAVKTRPRCLQRIDRHGNDSRWAGSYDRARRGSELAHTEAIAASTLESTCPQSFGRYVFFSARLEGAEPRRGEARVEGAR